jgi:hypothetical protein
VPGLSASRTRVMLLVVCGPLLGALGIATCPPPVAILLVLLYGSVVAVGLRAPQWITVAAGLAAALAFAAVRLRLAGIQSDPMLVPAAAPGSIDGVAFADAGLWASAVLGAWSLALSAVLALWCSRGLPTRKADQPALKLSLAGRSAPPVGRDRAQWVLAEAARGGRMVTLGLVGIDAPGDDDAEETDALPLPGKGEESRLEAMSRLDGVLRNRLPGDDLLCEYGPWERLLILPDVWAEDFRETAAQLVKAARQQVNRQVRVALITFPVDGQRAADPLDYLERALEVCRAGRTSVSVGRPRVRPLTPQGREQQVESA